MGDGNFKWWAGHGSDPELFVGPCDTREEAIAQARANYDDKFFTIVEADRSVARCDIFTAEGVFEQFYEMNENCWHEDDDWFATSAEQNKELEDALAKVLEDFLTRHDLVETRTLATIRAREFFDE